MALTNQEAIVILKKRYKISTREAKETIELERSDLRLFARDPVTYKLDRTMRLGWKDAADYEAYLDELERE
jgi:hypothetical protein